MITVSIVVPVSENIGREHTQLHERIHANPTIPLILKKVKSRSTANGKVLNMKFK